MRTFEHRSLDRKSRLAVVLVATTALLAACQPGWTNPLVGTGDGTGTVPGATNPPNAEVSLQSPRGVDVDSAS